MRPYETVLTFECNDERRASVIEASVEREVGEIEGDRTVVRTEREDDRVIVSLEASDVVALRAGINTWCSFVEVASEAAALGAR